MMVILFIERKEIIIMKFAELVFNKVLGFPDTMEDIGNGLKITNKELMFNNCLCKCDVIVDDNDNIVSVSAYRSLHSINTSIKLTNVTSNASIKRYFESMLTRFSISKNQINVDSKAKNAFERLADMGGELYVINNDIYFDLDSLNFKIVLNTNKKWEIYYLGDHVSTHDTLHQAVLMVVDNIRKEGALLPNL
jgi:hypothetical protein